MGDDSIDMGYVVTVVASKISQALPSPPVHRGFRVQISTDRAHQMSVHIHPAQIVVPQVGNASKP